jgi:hypothetical protein
LAADPDYHSVLRRSPDGIIGVVFSVPRATVDLLMAEAEDRGETFEDTARRALEAGIDVILGTC